MKKIKSFKMRFADNLMHSLVTVEGRTVKVKCINGEVVIDANEFEDIKSLRNRVYDLVKGTPCGTESVSALIELCL